MGLSLGMDVIDGASKMTGKPGHYDVYEGYQEDPTGPARLLTLARAASRRARAALDVEALAMGAVGLALGVALGATVAWKLALRRR